MCSGMLFSFDIKRPIYDLSNKTHCTIILTVLPVIKGHFPNS